MGVTPLQKCSRCFLQPQPTGPVSVLLHYFTILYHHATLHSIRKSFYKDDDDDGKHNITGNLKLITDFSLSIWRLFTGRFHISLLPNADFFNGSEAQNYKVTSKKHSNFVLVCHRLDIGLKYIKRFYNPSQLGQSVFCCIISPFCIIMQRYTPSGNLFIKMKTTIIRTTWSVRKNSATLKARFRIRLLYPLQDG